MKKPIPAFATEDEERRYWQNHDSTNHLDWSEAENVVAPKLKPVKIVCISDTHGLHRRVRVPDGDVLVHAGDLTSRGELSTVEDFNAWLGTLPHPHKVVIAGNHDFCFEDPARRAAERLTHATYLQDSGVTVAGLRIWGSPWQPWFHDWAFNLPRGQALKDKWDLIPGGTDILITHGPPHGIGDRTQSGERAGCEDLAEAVATRIRPKLHVFGHIHEGYGMSTRGPTTYVNASICTLAYQPVQPPIVVELP